MQMKQNNLDTDEQKSADEKLAETLALIRSRPNQTNDKDACIEAERRNNGEPIDWRYWLGRIALTPIQAAKLLFCIDPIKWPKDECYQDTTQRSDYLRKSRNGWWELIKRRAEWLEERAERWTLATLEKQLGNNTPYRMREALGKENQAALAESEPQSDAVKVALTNNQQSRNTAPRTNQSAAPPGVSAAVIIEKFRLGSEWHEKLRKAPSGKYKYLKGTWTAKGKKGKGGGMALFSPARIGLALFRKKVKNRLAIETTIQQQFSAFSDEWDAIVLRENVT